MANETGGWNAVSQRQICNWGLYPGCDYTADDCAARGQYSFPLAGADMQRPLLVVDKPEPVRYADLMARTNQLLPSLSAALASSSCSTLNAKRSSASLSFLCLYSL